MTEKDKLFCREGIWSLGIFNPNRESLLGDENTQPENKICTLFIRNRENLVEIQTSKTFILRSVS